MLMILPLPAPLPTCGSRGSRVAPYNEEPFLHRCGWNRHSCLRNTDRDLLVCDRRTVLLLTVAAVCRRTGIAASLVSGRPRIRPVKRRATIFDASRAVNGFNLPGRWW